ncbi:UNVERIFIED_CONTAM: Protein cramped-like [Gekko kuhli]
MVRRKKSPPGAEEPRNGMTVKLGGGEEGQKKPGKRAAGEEESLAEGAEGCTKEEKAGDPPAPPLQPPHGHDQHHFLRSSVRPQSKRLRKDPQAPPAAAAAAGSASSAPAKGKGGDNGGPSSGNSSGIPSSTPSGSSKSATRNLGSSAGEKEEGKKVRRQWESWSTEDKNTFFEGLYEHGKDFEAIQNNIALKYKKKSKPASMVKNKEQVRHFYYRTWHKISKYIDFDNVFSQGLKKSSLELYGLICYGELRKKIGGCMDDKNAAKLNELIQVGATTVRYKGRNLRIKAPMCRALKKLCDPDGISDEEDQKPVRLPLKVPVELQPRNNHAWARVQSLAQNPRLRMIVELHRKVSSLIEFLKQKWALHEVRIVSFVWFGRERKTLAERQLQDSGDPETSGSCSEEKTTLHLFPGENCTLTPLPGVARVVHSKAFCTVHWQESGRCKQSTKDSHLLPPAQILGIQSGQGTARGQVKYPRGAGAGARAESTTEAIKNTQPAFDATVNNAEDGSPETGVVEGVSPSPSVSSCLDKPPSGVQDAGGCLQKPVPTTRCAEGREAPVPEATPALPPSTTSCYCGPIPDLEELSLLDPFPRYMKSCQALIVPEKCLCTDRLNGKDLAAPSGSAEAGSLDAAQPARDRVVSPACGPSQSETQALPCCRPPAETCGKELSDAVTEDSQEKLSTSLPPPPPQGQSVAKSLKDDPNRLAQQVREEGWSLQTSESLTLAEVYLMMGKPNKLQLEYDWLSVSGPETQGSGEQTPKTKPVPPSAAFHKQKLLNCLLRLISTEVNPKPAPETSTVATSPLKPAQEEHALTPPGKVIAISTRSPGCARNQPSLRNKTFSPGATSSPSGLRNPSRSLSAGSDADGGLFAVPTTLPPNSRHGKPFLPSKETELSIRQHLDTISRTLLPRPSGNPSQHVCSFSILSNSSITGTIDLAAQSAGIIPGSPLPVLDAEGLSGVSPLSPDAMTAVVTGQDSTVVQQNGGALAPVMGPGTECRVPFLGLPSHPDQEAIPDGFQGTPVLSLPELPKTALQNGLPVPPLSSSEASTTRLSPPNVSALLDISLPGPPEDVLSQGEPATQISDSIIEIAISSGQYGENVSLSPAKLNGSDSSKSLPSPSCSPQQNWIASPTHDPQWYPNDSTDSSLSSLFSSFLSPEKGRKMLPTSIGAAGSTSLLGPSLLDGNSRDSFVSRSIADVAEVDSQLACMMNENSIDYISRFNDLAQELSIPEPTRRESLFDGGGGGGSGGPPIGDLSQ